MKILKKLVWVVSVLAFVMPSYAQKKRKFNPDEYLPRKGDFGIAVSVNPFTNFIGNMFNGNLQNTFNNSFAGDPIRPTGLDLPANLVSVNMKYFVLDNLAVRANLGWMMTSSRQNYYAQDDAAFYNNPLSRKTVTDSYLFRNVGGSFAAAVEYRIGNRRVQGVVGLGGIYAFSLQKEKFQYGNAMTELNQNPSCGIDPALGFAVDPADRAPSFSSQRYLMKFQTTPTHHIGPYAFIGVECFLAPYISLGGEVNISAVWSWRDANYYTSEGFNTLSGKVESWTELCSPSSSGFNFGTGNIGANITISFYFNRTAFSSGQSTPVESEDE